MPPLSAPRVSSIAISISPLWPHPVAMTPIASSIWPCAWWSKLACPRDPRVGTAGVLTGLLALVPRSNMGARQGGKRRRVTAKARCWRGPGRPCRALRQSMHSPQALTVCSQRWPIGRTKG
jgi:hypothetical protein